MAEIRCVQDLQIREYVYADGGHGIQIGDRGHVCMGYDAQDVYKLLEECLDGVSDLHDAAQAFLGGSEAAEELVGSWDDA